MHKSRVMRAVFGGAAALLVATGCNETTEGSAQPTTRNIDEIIVFNVCRDPGLSDEVLLQAGLDPADKKVLTDPPTGVSSFRACNWLPIDERYGPDNYAVTVFSTSHTLQEQRKKESAIVVGETTVNGRPGLITKERSDPEGCYIDFEAQQGMFSVKAGWLSEYESRDGDICEIAAQHADALEPNLPE